MEFVSLTVLENSSTVEYCVCTDPSKDIVLVEHYVKFIVSIVSSHSTISYAILPLTWAGTIQTWGSC
jgi:hypothetical protein